MVTIHAAWPASPAAHLVHSTVVCVVSAIAARVEGETMSLSAKNRSASDSADGSKASSPTSDSTSEPEDEAASESSSQSWSGFTSSILTLSERVVSAGSPGRERKAYIVLLSRVGCGGGAAGGVCWSSERGRARLEAAMPQTLPQTSGSGEPRSPRLCETRTVNSLRSTLFDLFFRTRPTWISPQADQSTSRASHRTA